MAIALSSLGVKVGFAVASDSSVPSSQSFTTIPQVKNIPNLSPAPETIEVTSLENDEYKTYIPGLKDLGGALEFTVNLTQDLLDLWNGTNAEDTNSVMYKFKNLADGNAMWIAVVHPKLDNAVYFQFEPVPLGLPEISVNAALEGSLALTPISEPTWATKPTLTDPVAPVAY